MSAERPPTPYIPAQVVALNKAQWSDAAGPGGFERASATNDCEIWEGGMRRVRMRMRRRRIRGRGEGEE